MSAALDVSTATMADLDDLVPLFDAYRQFYRKQTNLDAARLFLSDRLTKHDSAIFIARSENHKALGFAQMYPTLSSVMVDHVWLMNDLYVGFDARHSGAGHALIEKAKIYALRSGAKFIRVVVQDHNLAAQKIYLAHGFKKDDAHALYRCQLEAE